MEMTITMTMIKMITTFHGHDDASNIAFGTRLYWHKNVILRKRKSLGIDDVTAGY